MHGSYICQQPDLVDFRNSANLETTLPLLIRPVQRSASASVTSVSPLDSTASQKRTFSLRETPEPLDLHEGASCSEDGVVVFGREGLTFASYVTRYRVDREDQGAKISNDAIVGACSPCCLPEQTPGKFILRCFVSEAFLLSSHLIVLIVGVLRVLQVPPGDLLHSILSSIEMVLTCSHLLARFGLLRLVYNEFCADVAKLDQLEGISTSLNRRQWVLAALTALSILFSIGSYVILHLMQKQPWTLISNALLLALFTSASHLIVSHLQMLKQKTREDHVRVALLEALLLLKEGLAPGRLHQRKEHAVHVDCFMNALRSTKFFRKPGHVQLIKQMVKEWTGTEPETSC